MESVLQVNRDIKMIAPLTPIVRELPADLETPTSVYMKLRGTGPSFLLESVTGGEQVARYSFIGVQPSRAYVFQGDEVCIRDFHSGLNDSLTLGVDQNPLDILRPVLQRYPFQSLPGLPRLTGGLVGYLGYEMMRFFEPSVHLDSRADLPDAIFLQTETLVVFDHAFQKLLLIGIIHPDDPGYSAESIEAKLDDIEQCLNADIPARTQAIAASASLELQGNLTKEQFTQAVMTAREQIAAGEVFQVVLSQRLSRVTGAEPFEIYRALRRLNPSPYMFFFDFGDLAGGEPLRLIGASPEMHARLEGMTASVRPIAGTRRRGKTPLEDETLEEELLADTKELAEHVMLVDLGRNDLGRICQYGTVDVAELMVVERYSHVMHIVSHVQGVLRPGYDAFDLLRVTFPAGTVSGAPKIRAMQIIDELEPEPRGPYAGAVGYFSYDGAMDTCIAIRTMVMRGQRVEIQAGAGIVADSLPENEYQETLSKARALATAIEQAEVAA
jgi:anthranilate synthase component I